MIERVQYNAAFAITGAIKGTYLLKIYKELGLNPWNLEDGSDICTFL